jgi:hypothetical protein
LRGGLCRLGFRGHRAGGVLPRLLCGLLSLTGLFFGALRLAARLTELLLGLTELVLEVLQVALEIADLTLDRLDPVIRGGGLRDRIER